MEHSRGTRTTAATEATKATKATEKGSTFRMPLPIADIKAEAAKSPMLSESGVREAVAQFMQGAAGEALVNAGGVAGIIQKALARPTQ